MSNANEMYLHSETTEQIIKAYFHVYKKLGFGFIEKIYENSLAITLRKRGFEVQQQEPVAVYFEGELVGEYNADLIVNRKVIVELKSVETFHNRHEVQLLNYLRATPIEVGLLMNFGEKPAFKRRIFTNDRKSHSDD